MCPECRGDLVELDGGLGCAACHLRWPVVDGVPWMIPEEAEAWTG